MRPPNFWPSCWPHGRQGQGQGHRNRSRSMAHCRSISSPFRPSAIRDPSPVNIEACPPWDRPAARMSRTTSMLSCGILFDAPEVVQQRTQRSDRLGSWCRPSYTRIPSPFYTTRVDSMLRTPRGFLDGPGHSTRRSPPRGPRGSARDSGMPQPLSDLEESSHKVAVSRVPGRCPYAPISTT